jgi:hypothetical protein
MVYVAAKIFNGEFRVMSKGMLLLALIGVVLFFLL